MEEKEVRIPILGVIDVDKLEHREDIHLFKTYTHGAGIYLIKQANTRIALHNVCRSNCRDKEGNDYATWDEFILPTSIVIEDIKKEQETQLKEALTMVSDRLVATATVNNKLTSTLTESLNSLYDNLHNNVIKRLQSIEETLKQLTENGSASCNGISEKTLLEALAMVTKKL